MLNYCIVLGASFVVIRGKINQSEIKSKTKVALGLSLAITSLLTLIELTIDGILSLIF